jgi:omega-6 fatty acid desaturase (delta-12 desaturase)
VQRDSRKVMGEVDAPRGGAAVASPPDLGRESKNNLPAEIRDEFQRFRRKSLALALALFVLDAAAYAGCFTALVMLHWRWAFKIPLSFLLGFLITRLFIVGHDAAHGSLTGYRLLDAIVARVAFLPSLHPCSLWQVGHNRVHHAFTNLKGIDFIWIPFSPEEYNALPRWRQRAERFYRSTFGMGAYYMFEIWWKYLSVKGLKVLGQGRAIYFGDVALTVGFLCLQVMGVSFLIRSTGNALALTVFVAVVLPFLVWNWLMGFIIYNHHTAASVRFFNKRAQWRFYEGQVKGTVHLVFPNPIGMLLNGIMEHTAHHIDVNIPFYRLGAAQRFLEARMPDDLIVEKWSVRSFLSTLRCCQLYDYAHHRWVTFTEATSKGKM